MINRILFLTWGLLLSIHPCSAQSTDRGSVSIDRFLEVVSIVSQQWHDNRRGSVVAMAMEAAGAGRSEAYQRPLDDIARTRLASAISRSGGNGDVAIQRLIAQLDPWSSYLTPVDWTRFQSSQRKDYSGVGMDLEKESDGSFTCWPYPGSSAENAGIRPGAKLLAVEGISTIGRSLYAIGAQVRGQRGSQVNLTVSGMLGIGSRLNLLRAPAQVRTVFASTPRDGIQVVRIARFASSTPRELAAAVSPGTPSVEIDLSECSGGDLDAAVDAAGLFLTPGNVVVRIASNTGIETLRSSGGSHRGTRVILHQGSVTASAGEAFVVGLVGNNIASSYGSTTRGKATTQDIIPLRNRGALLLTTGLMSGPRAGTWQGSGLPSRR
jgi:carboxyl-terminal processing protease